MVCSSTRAAPRLDLTALYASYTSFLSMLNGLSVARIEVLLFPVASVMRPLDPTPSLQPHYELSSLLRVGPSQCSASVRSPRGFGRLGFSLVIRATGSCSSAQQPASASRPLYDLLLKADPGGLPHLSRSLSTRLISS